jgi:hypothetical protein
MVSILKHMRTIKRNFFLRKSSFNPTKVGWCHRGLLFVEGVVVLLGDALCARREGA